jgi:hypothetical protein
MIFDGIDVQEMENRIEVLEHRLGIDRKVLPSHGFDSKDLLQRLQILEKKLGIYKDYGDDLEELFDSFDSRTVQQILREIDAKDLVVAMLGMKKETILKIKSNVSKKSWSMLRDDLDYCMAYGVTADSIKVCRSKVTNVIHQLESQGEVVLSKTNGSKPDEVRRELSDQLWKNWDKENKQREENKKTIATWKKEVFDQLG